MQIVRGILCTAAIFALPLTASAQLTINYTFDNTTGFYTAPRQAAIQAAGLYAASLFDARGTITIDLNAAVLGGSTLAQAGSSFSFIPGTGSAANGTAFRQATTGTPAYSAGANGGTFNTTSTWYTGASSSGFSGIDMQSVALHESSHVLGFTSYINSDGTGGQNPPVASGSPDTFSRLDLFLRNGNTAAAVPLVTSDFRYNTAVPTSQIDSGNNYFWGEIAMAANAGNPVRMAVGNAHIHASASSNAVLLPSIGSGTARRTYTNLDLAILIDIGWNQFVWKGTAVNGNWADNVSSTSNSRWQSTEGRDAFSPVGTITTNVVLTFSGTGTSYTSTNNLSLTSTGDRFLINRMLLTASGGTNTIASNGTNVLRFDTTIGVAPLIRQDGAATYIISHPIELTNSNLQLGGNGTGTVTINGAISVLSGNTGGLTKSGSGTFVLSGNNTFNGVTTVSAGTLLANNATGSALGVGNVQVNNGATLGGTGAFTGAATIANGGTITAGAAAGGDRSLDTGALILQGLYRVTIFGLSNSDASRLNVGGTLDISTGSDSLLLELNGLSVATLRASGPHSYTVASSTALSGTTSLDFTTAGFDPGEWSISYPSNTIQLNFTPVPEPLSLVAFAAASLGLFGVRRHRRRRENGRAIPIILA